MMKSVRTRIKKGSILCETVALIGLMLPIVLATIFVAIEASRAFTISRGMTEAAVLTCRALARNYKTDSDLVDDISAQQEIFSSIRIANLVHDNSQFEITNWNLSNQPYTVTVKVTYIPGAGEHQLSTFPTNSPLNLPSTFQVAQAVTYRLEE